MSSFTSPLKYSPTGTFRSKRPLYSIDEPFTYVIGSIDNSKWEIIVPAGFITDFMSVPWPFCKLFPPDGKYSKAATLHDYMYRSSKFEVSQFVADAILYEALIVSGANKIGSFIVWCGVRIFGRIFFKRRD